MSTPAQTLWRQAIIKAMAICVVTSVIFGMAGVQARMPKPAQGSPLQLAQTRDIGASAAAAAASAASGGRVLDVQRQNSTTGTSYRVKVLLPGGRVRSMTVDGQTGQVRG